MAFLRTRRAGAGGGGGQTLAWAMDETVFNAPFSSGVTINLSQTPVDGDALIVYSQNNPLDTVDYNYLTGPPRVVLLFGGDPAVDYPETGEWRIRFQFPYAI
jgi:hypothetical protein